MWRLLMKPQTTHAFSNRIRDPDCVSGAARRPADDWPVLFYSARGCFEMSDSLTSCIFSQDGAVHASLEPAQILYLTIAYDWFLFG